MQFSPPAPPRHRERARFVLPRTDRTDARDRAQAASARHATCAPADLRRHTLLHSLARPDDWASWLASVGEKKIDGYDGLKFESSALAFEAAVQGMGVAIGSRVLITEALAEGTLIAPFALTCRLSSNYYLVRPAGRTASRALRIFRQYLLDELQRRGAV